jgi:ABC-type branched-subunit amino acid transport system substrate-binding protein
MKKVLIVLALSLALFTLSACGGEDNAQGVTDTTVTVGNTAATSGALAFVGVPFNQAIEAYFDMVNAEGGVNGRTIEFKHYDDGFDPAQGLAYTQTLVEDDQVFALVGHFGTPTVGNTLEYLDGVGIPRVYYATGISALFNTDATDGERSSFPVQPIYDAEGEVMVARAIAEFGAENIGVIYTNADDGRGLLNGIQLRADIEGVNIPAIIQVAPTQTDMSAAAQVLIDAGVDVILVAANQAPATTAILALNAQGNTVPVITSYVNANDTWLAGVSEALANFEIYASSWIDIFDGEGNFNDDYLLFAEEVSKIDPALAANSYAFAGWIAAATFVEGLRRVGDEPLTWENYINAMEEEPVPFPFGGLLDFAEGRRVGTQAMAFLKGTVDGDTITFANEKPIQTITEILEQE